MKLHIKEKSYKTLKGCGHIIFRYKSIALIKHYGNVSHYTKDIIDIIWSFLMCIGGVVIMPIYLIYTLLTFIPRFYIIKGDDSNKNQDD
ncbi:hypothetical protein G8V07_14665 [Clostridium botulinum D/C]|uniref:hypothetical protein n=1 Tax=Clostridium botulinum TaxID=1491 RepID=UPI001E395970|nr:hypothetical protein [Clostridium botulinum]MCD3321685.1 hypothetical protein [Clostridium botulinum D/C]MCD3324966.1 hypothetical protein [Clostridium botulinum D/C]MCD3327744.1 hypothetical protein [Clostridium botulinum D/C]